MVEFKKFQKLPKDLKALAKELNVPVVALSQLSRAVEQRDDKIPQLIRPERVRFN